MIHLPLSIDSFFIGTTLLTLYAFAKAVRGSKMTVVISIIWLCIQSAIALSGFYLVTDTVPPRVLLALAPPVLAVGGLILTAAGRRFLDVMDLKWCVLLHAIRVLVELTLYLLFLYKQVPSLMTFEGGNVDILVGITAPLVWWAFSTGKMGRAGLLTWNTLSLLSVLNAFARAMLSAPFRFQRFAFDQPTVAILHFPFVLLPAFLVPVVIFCHLAVFRKLSTSSV